MTLLEAGVALFVMTAAIVAVLELVAAVAHEQRARRQRQVALIELGNQAERIVLLEWSEASADRLTTWQPSEMLLAAIPESNCAVHVVDEVQPFTARRIALTVTWKNAAGEEVRPAKLTVWKFAPEASP